MKKTVAQVCADVVRKTNEKEFDIGKFSLGALIWKELEKQKIIKKNIYHPFKRLVYLSNRLAIDIKRPNSCWFCCGKVYYRGIHGKTVSVYRLRDNK